MYTPEVSTMKKLLALAADAMAGFLDLTVGVLIVFGVGKYYGIEVPLWHLGVGALLAFLPDFDALLMLARRGIQKAEGDHRLTLMHRPLIMVPLCTVAAVVIGGKYWAIVTTLCLLWHYVHDSRWLSVSDINWFWPLTNRKLPYMDHPVWREKYWLRPTFLSITEVALGTAIAASITAHYGGLYPAILLALILLGGASGVWAAAATR